MKNLLLFLSLTMNTAALFIACSKSETKNAASSSSTVTASDQRPRRAGNSNNLLRSTAPAMPYSVVAQMIGNYRVQQYNAVNSVLGISDARAACFELDSIEQYISILRAKVEASGCASLNRLGIRFYYAAYSNPAENGLPLSYSRKHTLVMIPAYRNAAGVYVDFDPSRIDLQSCTPLPLSAGPGITSLTSADSVYAMDHPMLSPPPAQGMAF